MYMRKTQEKEVLGDEAVKELQDILLEEYGQTLSSEETKTIGTKLISLYTLVLPIEHYRNRSK